eukprot:COSAG06_NODE_84_length_25090_cov_20.561042_32_plen_49_part_01
MQAGGFAAQVMELATTCFLKIVIRAKHGHSAIKAWLNDVSFRNAVHNSH